MTEKQISFTALGIAIVTFLMSVAGRVFPDFLTRSHKQAVAADDVRISIDQVVGLQDALDGKAAAGHNHDDKYAAADHNHDDKYAAADHNHDGK